VSARRGVATLVGALLALGVAAPAAVAQDGTTTTLPGGSTIVDVPAPGTGSDVVGQDPSATTTPGTPTTGTIPEIPASSVPGGALIDGPDRAELAQSLAEATTETGVCFGYEIVVSGSGLGGRPNADRVSSGGPDRTPSVGSCSRGSLTLDVSLNYTCSSCESEDSARYTVRSTVPGLSGSEAKRRLERLTGLDEKALLGDDDDLALRNATAALPLLVGGDPATPEAQATVPNGDRLTDKPGSDWLRANGLDALFAIVVLIVGSIVAAFGWRAVRAERRREARRAPRRPSPGTGPSGASPSSGGPPDGPTRPDDATGATGSPGDAPSAGDATAPAPSRWAPLPPADPPPAPHRDEDPPTP